MNIYNGIFKGDSLCSLFLRTLIHLSMVRKKESMDVKLLLKNKPFILYGRLKIYVKNDDDFCFEL